MDTRKIRERWGEIVDSGGSVQGKAKAKYGARPYSWEDIYELVYALETGWRKKWPAEIYAVETEGGKQAIREAFMLGKIKRM